MKEYKTELCYPIGFNDTENAVEVSEDEINKWIEECLIKLRSCEAGEYSFCASGDNMVIVMKYDDEYSIRVCPKYKEITIPREFNEVALGRKEE